MELICNTTEFQIKEPTAVAVGKFDGLHLGHMALLKEILRQKERGMKTAVFTFDPSPGAYFFSLSIQVSGVYRELMTREEKRRMFEKLGVDYLVEYPFGRETAAVTPEDYVNQFLLGKMNARLIAAGEDVSFGKNGAGDATLLQEQVRLFNEGRGEAERADVKILPKICRNGEEISSTLVRSVLSEGRMEETTQLLGRPFFISGIVSEGNRLGRSLGMPTANLYPEVQKLLPPNGVYFSKCMILDEEGRDEGRIFGGITNIGCKPTIAEKERRISVETTLFDFDEDIYGRQICVELLHHHRIERQFADLEALKAQMKQDAEACRQFLVDSGIMDMS